MSTNYAPSLRVTDRPGSGPSAVVVAQARFEEAKAITAALLGRLDREQAEWEAAPFVERLRVAQRIEATRVLLGEAGDHEERSFQRWERERSLASGKPVAGVRGASKGPQALRSVSTISGPSASHLRPSLVGTSPRGKRIT